MSEWMKGSMDGWINGGEVAKVHYANARSLFPHFYLGNQDNLTPPFFCLPSQMHFFPSSQCRSYHYKCKFVNTTHCSMMMETNRYPKCNKVKHRRRHPLAQREWIGASKRGPISFSLFRLRFFCSRSTGSATTTSTSRLKLRIEWLRGGVSPDHRQSLRL